MTVRVLIERHIKEGKEDELKELLKELRNKAAKQPGYISGETFRSAKDSSILLVISTWLNLEDWQAWKNNPERALVQSKIAQLLIEPTRTNVYIQI